MLIADKTDASSCGGQFFLDTPQPRSETLKATLAAEEGPIGPG